MNTRRLEIPCPVCGSADVYYTCTPNCCFNHVCNGCGATFEPVTRAKGGAGRGIEAPDPPPDPAGPTAACAKCESIAVYLMDDGGLVCGNCGALLELEITEVSGG